MKVLNKILRNLFFGKNLLIILGVIKILIIFDKIVLSKIKGSVLIIMEMKMVNYWRILFGNWLKIFIEFNFFENYFFV